MVAGCRGFAGLTIEVFPIKPRTTSHHLGKNAEEQLCGGNSIGDAKYGERDEALRAALLQLERTPLIGVKFSKFSRNTSGVIGVSPVRYKGKVVAFKAIAGSPHSKPRATVFSFVQWGELGAWALAVHARGEFIAEIESKELNARNKKIRAMLRKLGKMATR